MSYDKFELGDVTLLSGEVLHSAFLAYKTYGKLDAYKVMLLFCLPFILDHIKEMKDSSVLEEQ